MNTEAQADALKELTARAQRVSLLMQLFSTSCFLGNKTEMERIKVNIDEELQLYYAAVERYAKLSGA